ncbi:ribosomal-protein-alanine N-acetyltransferase [Martelella mediterranea]|uniref:Ribosomal-protein-alanine N-acetyltransferase n=2 Tax=Martelella mediterranea TaxID=293089 RepID=A0A4R3NVB2_9HYPH|nr:ribosomal-protein-alanine N-acetyltransferase [Martelella mediterranea]
MQVPFLWRNPEFEFFPMDDEHLGLAAEVHRKCFSHAWSAGELHKLNDQKTVFGFIMRQTNRLVRPPASGFVLSRVAFDEAEILTICVDPQFQRNGIGWRLMTATLTEAKAQGAAHMLLEVDAENQPAIGLYRKLGFSEVGRRKAYYTYDDGTRSTALVMRRDLG